LPLAAAVVAGLLGRRIGRVGAHSVAIAGVALSCVLSLHVLWQIYWQGVPAFDAPIYTWLVSDGVPMQVGFLIDRLSALMMAVVTFVSLCVHVYTVGYMRDDPGYQRFFSYISLFTFAMLMLVMANNFMQLFFGWEGGRPRVVPADRLLVHAAERDRGESQGIPRQPGRRLRLRARHRRSALLHRIPALQRRLQRRAADGDPDAAAVGGHERAGADAHLHLPLHRRHGQVRAGAAARMAARFHGRPDAHIRADPRRDHGDRRHLHGRAHVAAL
jgi:hypothetical protein